MATVYNIAKARLIDGRIDLDTDDIRVMLVTSSYVVNADHDFVTDITNELSGTNYVRKSLANKSVTLDDTNDRSYFDADDVVWTDLGPAGTAAAAVLFKWVTADADSPLLSYHALTPTVITNGGTVTVQWSANGIFRVS